MISDITKVEALLSGITADQLNKLGPMAAVRFARALRRIADIADPPLQPQKSTAEIIAAARTACLALHTDGVLGQLTGGEHAENSDEERYVRPWNRPKDVKSKNG